VTLARCVLVGAWSLPRQSVWVAAAPRRRLRRGKGSVDAAVIGDPIEILDGNSHCPPQFEGTFRTSPESVPVSFARPGHTALDLSAMPRDGRVTLRDQWRLQCRLSGGAHRRTTRTVQCARSSTSRLTAPNTASGSGQALDCSTSA